MRRILILLVVLFASITTFLLNTNQAHAMSSDSSAKLQLTLPKAPVTQGPDNRAKILKIYLERYNSPLAEYSDTFVEEADKNNIDWKLVASISGVESTYGKAIPASSYNGWGFGIYGNHVLRFTSWKDGIQTVSKSLRDDYIDKYGAKNVYEIGAIYAASPTWASRVSYNMSQIEELQHEVDSSTLPITL